MKKDFESRFMPNVKFKIKGDITKCSDFFNTKMLQDGLFDAITDMNGRKIFHIPNVCFDSCIYKEVSIYEAIPELIPDGMRYNKELDKLVPDSCIKVGFERVNNGDNHIAFNGTPFDTLEETLDYNFKDTTIKNDKNIGFKVELEKVADYTKENISCKNEKSKHYELWSDFEAIDVLKNCLNLEEYVGFLKGNILKYQLRLGKKDDVSKEIEKIKDYQNELNFILKESNVK